MTAGDNSGDGPVVDAATGGRAPQGQAHQGQAHQGQAHQGQAPQGSTARGDGGPATESAAGHQREESREESEFGLRWPGRAAALAQATRGVDARLEDRPDDEESDTRESYGAPSTTPRHRLLLGDNLDALKLLGAESPAEPPFDLIYIDPPYNTAVDLVYRSRYRAGNRSLAGLHAEWLDLMLPRLVCAHRLLDARGVLAVSIDQHESHNLRHLLDEIFGPAQFVAEIAVSLNPKGRQLTRFFATSHEYLLLYARDRTACALHAGSRDEIDPAQFPHEDADGRRHRLLPLRNTNKKFHPGTRPNLHYPLHVDLESGSVSTEPGANTKSILPVFGDGSPAVWRWSVDKAARQHDELLGREIRGARGRRWDVFQKDFLDDDRTKKLRTVWLSDEVGSTDRAVDELKQLVGAPFDTPKPLGLLRRVLGMMPTDARVLDFFAGSGTTGHAVLDQNRADGGSRRFVLCQQHLPLDPDERSQQAAAAWCDAQGLPRDLAELTIARIRAAARRLAAEPGPLPDELSCRIQEIVSD